jgi:glycosyltransferase involved in cell wall biosynthesis
VASRQGLTPLRVAIDLTQVDNQTLGSGQYRYARDLVAGLCALDVPLALTLLGSTAHPSEEFADVVRGCGARCRYVALPPYAGRGYYYRDVARLTWWLAAHKVDVFHQLHTNIPLVKPCPLVVTGYHYFHDPALFATRPHRYYRWALRRRVDLVITISDATRADFHDHLGVPFARMRTVHPGLSPAFSGGSPRPGTRPYLLAPYALTAPKNLRSLILAWPAIAERHRDAELLLYGGGAVPGGPDPGFVALLDGVAHADRVRRLGHVADGELASLYAGCALFVFPTIVEGFGYPLLEAMAQGACCIARGASAMQEIGGDAVRLVETLHPEEIATAALQLLGDPEARDRLGDRARRRAAQFTVAASARQTFDCYRQAVSGVAPEPSDAR